jgi:hypothetical protein
MFFRTLRYIIEGQPWLTLKPKLFVKTGDSSMLKHFNEELVEHFKFTPEELKRCELVYKVLQERKEISDKEIVKHNLYVEDFLSFVWSKGFLFHGSPDNIATGTNLLPTPGQDMYLYTTECPSYAYVHAEPQHGGYIYILARNPLVDHVTDIAVVYNQPQKIIYKISLSGESNYFYSPHRKLSGKSTMQEPYNPNTDIRLNMAKWDNGQEIGIDENRTLYFNRLPRKIDVSNGEIFLDVNNWQWPQTFGFDTANGTNGKILKVEETKTVNIVMSAGMYGEFMKLELETNIGRIELWLKHPDPKLVSFSVRRDRFYSAQLPEGIKEVYKVQFAGQLEYLSMSIRKIFFR